MRKADAARRPKHDFLIASPSERQSLEAVEKSKQHIEAFSAVKIAEEIFGDQIKFDGNAAHWQSELIQDVLKGTVKKAKLGIGFDGKNLSISHTIFKEHLAKHVGDAETHGKNIPLTPGDYDLLPSIWRHPESISHEHNRAILSLSTYDDCILKLIVDPIKGIVSFYKIKKSGGRLVGWLTKATCACGQTTAKTLTPQMIPQTFNLTQP